MMRNIHRFVATSAVCAIAAFAASLARAAEPVYGVTYIEVAPGSDAKAAMTLKTAAAGTRQEAGSIAYVALERIGIPGQFAILEIWTDKQAMDDSVASEPVKQMQAAPKPLALAPIDRRPQTPVIVDIDSTKAALATIDLKSMIVMTHVDIAPATKDQGLALVREMDAVRTAATLTESLSGYMLTPLAGHTEESGAVNLVPVLSVHVRRCGAIPLRRQNRQTNHAGPGADKTGRWCASDRSERDARHS
jgi:quinol monooxygenase YgiN